MPFRVCASTPFVLRLTFADAAMCLRFREALEAEHAPVMPGDAGAEIEIACRPWFGEAEVATITLQVLKVAHYLATGDSGG